MVEISYQQEQAIRRSTELEFLSEKLRGISILFVEDEYVNFLFFSELLSDIGIKFYSAYTLSQILENLAMKDDISLVVVSSSLITHTKFEIIRSIKMKYPDLPIITIVSNNNLTAERACVEAGSDLYLSRFIDKSNLIEAIVELLKVSQTP
jgi:CheY-like chemotaxis protein